MLERDWGVGPPPLPSFASGRRPFFGVADVVLPAQISKLTIPRLDLDPSTRHRGTVLLPSVRRLPPFATASLLSPDTTDGWPIAEDSDA